MSTETTYSGSRNVTERINLGDLIRIEDIQNTKIRFNARLGGTQDPVQLFQEGDIGSLLEGHYWNSDKKRSYRGGQTTIGLIRLQQSDQWLLFHIGKIVKDLNALNAMGYEYTIVEEYRKYFGRLVVRYKNKDTNMIRWAAPLMEQIEVAKILDDVYDSDVFPGYEKVNVTWRELSRVVKKESWLTALKNQKGVYLITDSSNGKRYVGSGSGKDMLLSRWSTYVKNGNGGNKQLMELPFDHIKQNFRYSILDIYKSTTSKDEILERESWWKNVLMTREFGYNSN